MGHGADILRMMSAGGKLTSQQSRSSLKMSKLLLLKMAKSESRSSSALYSSSFPCAPKPRLSHLSGAEPGLSWFGESVVCSA